MDFFLVATVLVCYLIFKAFRKSQAKVNLKSKNVLITGASSGLGKSLAENLCKHHNVNLFLCARSVGKLEELKKDLKAINPNNVVEVYYLDLCKTETIGDFVGSLVQNHKIDTIINNAGVRFRGDILSTSYEVYKKVFETNFFGQVALTNGFVKYFVKSGIKGHIVNIGSVQVRCFSQLFLLLHIIGWYVFLSKKKVLVNVFCTTIIILISCFFQFTLFFFKNLLL